MKWWYILAIVAVLLIQNRQADQQVKTIDENVNGQFLWLAYIKTSTGKHCAGSLISDEWILTVADCIKDVPSFTIHLGVSKANATGEVVSTANISVTHDGYKFINHGEIENNIGLIKLPNPVAKTDVIKPIRLPESPKKRYADSSAIVVGWETDEVTLRICENEWAILQCEADEVIEISKTFYGKAIRNTCIYNSVTNCMSKTADASLKKQCESKQSCNLTVTSEALGGDPCPGVPKYVEIQYSCFSEKFRKKATFEKLEVIPNKICKTFYPLIANYSICCRGRLTEENTADEDHGGPLIIYEQDGNPTLIGLMNIFTTEIGDYSNQPSGFIRVSSFLHWIHEITKNKDHAFTKSTKKVANNDIITVSTCESNFLTIECDPGKFILIGYGFYGRAVANTCGYYRDTTCSSTTSDTVIKKQCNYQQTCTLLITSKSLLSDPCPSVIKYAQVQYVCAPDFSMLFKLSKDIAGPMGGTSKLHLNRGKLKSGNNEGSLAAGQNITGENSSADLDNANTLSGNNTGSTGGSLAAGQSAAAGGNSSADLDNANTLSDNNAGSNEGSLAVAQNAAGNVLSADLANSTTLSDGNAGYDEGSVADAENAVEGNSSAVKMIFTRVCQNRNLTIKCKPGEDIKITKGFYGREIKQIKLCGYAYNNANCSTPNADAFLRKTCDFKNFCTLMVTNEVFGGDSCPAFVKYAEVYYICLPDFNKIKTLPGNNNVDNTTGVIPMKNLVVCEHRTLNIECKHGEVIHIVDAFYGRLVNLYCGDYKVTDCISTKANAVLRTKCNHKQSCTLTISNNLFGGDPCAKVIKYVDVNYSCVTKSDLTKKNTLSSVKSIKDSNAIIRNNIRLEQSTVDVITLRVCEFQNITIACKIGEIMVILDGFYGRAVKKIRQCGSYDVTNCTSKTADEIIRSKCDFKQTCTMRVINDLFGGNPCPNVYKYIKVEYICISASQIIDKSPGNNVLQSNLNTTDSLSGNNATNTDLNTTDSLSGNNATNTGGMQSDLNTTDSLSGNNATNTGGMQSDLNTTDSLSGNNAENIGGMQSDLNTTDSLSGNNAGSIDTISTNATNASNATANINLRDYYKKKTVCDSEILTIECKNGEVIIISRGFYGRASNDVCGVADTNCTCEHSDVILKNICDFKQSCSLMITSHLFSCKSCPEIRKYAEVEYVCYPEFNIHGAKDTIGYKAMAPHPTGTRTNYISKLVCDSERLSLECKPGEFILLVKAFYGRVREGICGYPHVGHCSSKLADVVMKEECDFKRYCTLMVSSYLFGADPCPKIPKYLSVQFVCYSETGHVNKNFKMYPTNHLEGPILDSNTNKSDFLEGELEKFYEECTITNKVIAY